jgi:hypothetical protein
MAARRLTPSEELRARRMWAALDAYALTMEPKVSAAFRAALAAVRTSITEPELVNIVATGDVDAILQRIDWQGVQFALRDAVVAAAEQTPLGFVTSGQTVGLLPSTIQVRFNVLAPQAVQALNQYESRAMLTLQQDVRAGVNEWLMIGLQRGWNPVRTARQMRELIGLPPNLMRAVDNHRRGLETGDRSVLDRALRDKRSDSVIRAAINANKPLAPEYINRRVELFRDRALQFNAETIARTASMDAVVTGQRLWWDEATTQDVVDRQTIRRYWIVAADERTCMRCRPIPALNPDGVGMDQLFITPEDGMVLQPTLHFRCRCIIYYMIIEY